MSLLKRLRWNAVISTSGILWSVWRAGREVGLDHLGNRYFTGPAQVAGGRERRWVVYKGEPEASTIPPEWHGWMHHQTNEVPGDINPLRRAWQKPPEANLTGTAQAYRPPGYTLNGGTRAASASGDYEAWSPDQS